MISISCRVQHIALLDLGNKTLPLVVLQENTVWIDFSSFRVEHGHSSDLRPTKPVGIKKERRPKVSEALQKDCTDIAFSVQEL